MSASLERVHVLFPRLNEVGNVSIVPATAPSLPEEIGAQMRARSGRQNISEAYTMQWVEHDKSCLVHLGLIGEERAHMHVVAQGQ